MAAYPTRPVPGGPGNGDWDAYRDEADRFLTDLYEEEYRHYAGLKPELELEPIYDRYADLTTLDVCRELAPAARAEPANRPPALELWRFACEGYLGRLTRAQAERLAALEATLEAEVDGERIPFRMLRPALANEPDQGRRERLDRARVDLGRQLVPLAVEALEIVREAAWELGSSSYRSLYERFGYTLGPLAEQCERFLSETEDLYASAFDRLLRSRLGFGLEAARRWDIPRLLRAPVWDEGFPADRMLPALEGTLAELGIDLRAQRNVHLDLEERPTKDPRAFCAPIEVPGRVMLVIKPIGGLDDWRALFHEAGHTEHFAHTSAHLPFEARRLGDSTVTEGWAFLLEHLVTTPAWLARRLDVGRPDEISRDGATTLLYYVRRYCGKLLYELELHAGAALDEMPDRYVERMREATMLEYAPVDFLADVDPAFYVTCYLGAWALEAQLSAHLRAEHGRTWFADRRAGSLVRELWSEGQGLDGDTLAREVTGASLDLAAVADEVRALLNA
jgi:hypothetical protein